MANSVVFPRAQFFSNSGRPLVGGRIHTYVAGSSTRASTYQDAANAQINTNPIILDARGEAAIYLAEGVEYKFVVEDSTGALIMTQEPVYGAVWNLAAPSGAGMVGFQPAGAGAVSTTVQSKLREFASVEDFGAVGDCTGVGLGTDDSAAFQAALDWLRSGPYRTLKTMAGKRYRIANPVMPTTTPAIGSRFIMLSPITPDATAMTAISLYSFRDAEFRLMVSAGGQDADYSQADPVGMAQAFDIRGCRRLHGEIYSRAYLGRALRVSSGGNYKMSFMYMKIDCGDNTPSLDAEPTGQGFFFDSKQSAAGGFHYANTAWTKYGSVIDSAVDVSIGHWEMGSTQTSNEFRGCGSIWLGTVLAGDETQTQTMLRFTQNSDGTPCRRVDIKVFQGVMADTCIHVDKLSGADSGLTIHNMLTNQSFVGIRVSSGSSVTVLNHESDADRNAIVVDGTVGVLDYRVSARSASQESIKIESAAAGAMYLRGSSDNPSRSSDGVDNAHVKIASTNARVQLVDMTMTGTAKACVDAAGTNYRIRGGRYVTATKFSNAEPESIDHAQGIANNRMFTATIPSGATSVTVAHGLFSTPSYVLCSGKSSETASAYASFWDATNVTIDVPAATTADRQVDVIAARRP